MKEWRKLKTSRTGKAKRKNIFIMNVIMDEVYQLGIEHGISKRKRNKTEQTSDSEYVMLVQRDHKSWGKFSR